jgi:hypothetical protein
MYHPEGFRKSYPYTLSASSVSCPVLRHGLELGTPLRAHVTPPELSLPGPFVNVRYRTQLAA